MLYAYRPCGISVGHAELIHAETCTDFVLLIIELFGENPSPDTLTGVAIDRFLWQYYIDRTTPFLFKELWCTPIY